MCVTINYMCSPRADLLVGCAGYAAFGNAINSNILEQFTGPRWLLDVANVLVLLHMVPAYQVFSQPFLCFVEDEIKENAKAPGWAKVGGGALDQSLYNFLLGRYRLQMS